jgi:hypothetical protein
MPLAAIPPPSTVLSKLRRHGSSAWLQRICGATPVPAGRSSLPLDAFVSAAHCQSLAAYCIRVFQATVLGPCPPVACSSPPPLAATANPVISRVLASCTAPIYPSIPLLRNTLLLSCSPSTMTLQARCPRWNLIVQSALPYLQPPPSSRPHTPLTNMLAHSHPAKLFPTLLSLPPRPPLTLVSLISLSASGTLGRQFLDFARPRQFFTTPFLTTPVQRSPVRTTFGPRQCRGLVVPRQV